MKNISINTIYLIARMIDGTSANKLAEEQVTTVSSIGKRIRNAEDDLNTTLFTQKYGGKKEPTETALQIKPFLDEILSNFAQIEYLLSRSAMKEPLRRPISSYSAYSDYFKSKLPVFKNHSVFETDEIKVEVEELESSLLKGDVDFAFISFPKNKQMLETTLILNDTPHIIVTEDHPLAKREFVTSLDLNGLQLQAALDSVQYRLKLKELYPALVQKLQFKDTSFTPDEIFHVFGISENTIFFKLGSLQSHSDLLVSIPIIDLPKDELYFCTSLSMRNDPRIIEIKNSLFK